MKKLIMLFALLFSVGAYATSIKIDVGQEPEVYKVTLSSVAGTAIVSPTRDRVDGLWKNYGGYVIFIGTVSATEHGVTHSNILNGLPHGASSYFNLGGMYSGSWYGTCEPGVASCEIRYAGTKGK